METYANRQYFRKFLTNLSTLGQWNRSIECPDTCGTIKNGFPMKKYVGAMVRWSFQLAIAAEQGHFENKNPCTKKVQLFLPTGTLKKNKTIFQFFQCSAGSKKVFFFARELLFSKRSCSAAIASWKDFRTTAPMYFVLRL